MLSHQLPSISTVFSHYYVKRLGMAGVFIALALGSVVFLSVALIVSALMLRGKWERMGSPDSSDPFEK